VARRNLYGCLAVLAVIVAIAVGLPSIDGLLPGGRLVPTGHRISVGRGVAITAVDGTVLDLARTAPLLNRVVLSVNGVRVVVESSAYTGSLTELSARLRRKIQSNPGYQASQRDHPTRTTSGVPGLQGSYTTPGRIGMYAVFVHDDVGAEISIAGTQTDLHRNNEALLDMVASLTFGGGS